MNQAQFPVPESPMPLKGTMDNILGIAQLAALSVRLPLRKNIGLDMLKKMHLAGVVVLMLVTSWVGNVHVNFSMFGGFSVQSDNDSSLFYYALLVLSLGIWQRVQRLREEKQGTEPHTYWPGDGWFYGFIPLDRKIIDAFVDPAVALIVGALLRYELGCGLLGLWLMGSGIALCVMEKLWQVRAKEFLRAHKNIQKEGMWLRDYEQSRPKGGAAAENGGGSAVVIPTGTDDALQALIDKNKLDNSFDN
jgi:hypothetical protein